MLFNFKPLKFPTAPRVKLYTPIQINIHQNNTVFIGVFIPKNTSLFKSIKGIIHNGRDILVVYHPVFIGSEPEREHAATTARATGGVMGAKAQQ